MKIHEVCMTYLLASPSPMVLAGRVMPSFQHFTTRRILLFTSLEQDYRDIRRLAKQCREVRLLAEEGWCERWLENFRA